MVFSEKITINNKIKQNKARQDLGRQIVKSSVLSSGNVGKHDFLTGKEVMPEKTRSKKFLQSKELNIYN